MEQKQFQEGLYTNDNGVVILHGSRCKSCGKVQYPAADRCTGCCGADMEPTELSRTGELLSYTVTRVPVGKLPLPHAVGIVDLPEGVRITAPLVPADEYHIGKPYTLVEDVLYTEENVAYLCYKFKEGTHE